MTCVPVNYCATVALSHLTFTVRLFHWLPHTAAAKAIGKSSLTVMLYELIGSTHWSGNQSWPDHASHPQEPEASVVHILEGLVFCCATSMYVPFHGKTAPLSTCTERLRYKWWSKHFVTIERSIKQGKGVHSAHITLQAWDNRPINVHALRPLHTKRVDFSYCNLDRGKGSSSATVSNH